MRKVLLTIFAPMLVLSLQAQSSPSLYLGERFIPSSISYQDLARAIDREFEDLDGVVVTSLHYSPTQRRFDSRINTGRVVDNVKLRFRAKVTGEELIQIFQCQMYIYAWKSGEGSIYIGVHNCQNYKDLIIEFFTIDSIMESSSPRDGRLLR